MKCLVCGKELKERQKKYCSRKCSCYGVSSEIMSQTGICGICGQPFKRTCIPGNHRIAEKYGVNEVCPNCREHPTDDLYTFYEMRCTKCGNVFWMPGTTFRAMLYRVRSSGKESKHVCKNCHKSVMKNLVPFEESQRIVAHFLSMSSLPKHARNTKIGSHMPFPDEITRKIDRHMFPSEYGKSLKIEVPKCEIIEW